MSRETKSQNKIEEYTITGYVVDYETEDERRGLFISTDHDEDYIVKLDQVGEELFDCLDDRMEVTGFVEYDSEGDRYITLKSFSVIDDDYDEDEESYNFDEWQ